MIRRAPDGRQSLIDLIAHWMQTSKSNAYNWLQRLTGKGFVPDHDTVIFGGYKPTPIVTEEQWAEIRSHLPLTRHNKPDLYVMQYSNADDVVKIGRSYDVEKRRRSLETGHNFFVTLIAAFPGQGHLESLIHDHLQVFRSRAGAGREWFTVSKDQAIKAIQFLVHEHERYRHHAHEGHNPKASRFAQPAEDRLE